MGLDTSHECWHGAYSAFTRWRNTLAEAAGYEIIYEHQDGTIWRGPDWPPTEEVVKHGNSFPCADIDWSAFKNENFQGEWPEGPPEDPLLLLIVHSDCDGLIHPQHAPWLAERLEQLLPLLPTEPDQGHIGDWREKTQKFIDGLRAAAEAGEDVEFY